MIKSPVTEGMYFPGSLNPKMILIFYSFFIAFSPTFRWSFFFLLYGAWKWSMEKKQWGKIHFSGWENINIWT